MEKASTLFVRKNLKWLMGDRISPYALAAATGIPQPTIFRILTGESSDPRTATLKPLAAYFGIGVADLRDRDLALLESTHISPALKGSITQLDDKQYEWLALRENLGSDDIAEFTEIIRARQERNVRLFEELENSMHPKRIIKEKATLDPAESNGKKQSSQSSS